MPDRLKLIAMDSDDLAVISAHCQDAVLKAGAIKFHAREQRLILAMNRFVWERPGKGGKWERRQAVLHFDRVSKVLAKGVDRRNKDQVLELLAIAFVGAEAPAGHVELAFAGGATLRADVECLEARLSDLDAAWETGSRPAHEA
jgi:hypothetical protein